MKTINCYSELIAAKTDNIASMRTSEEAYREALAAIREYIGFSEEDADEEDDDEDD